jgi:DNA-binding protein YbaB
VSDRLPRDPRSMMARIEEMQRQAEQTLAKYEELQGQFGSASVEVYSDDGLIRVALDAEGHIEAVELHEYALRFGHALGERIRFTVERAKAQHSERAAEFAQQLLGDKVDIQAILNQYRPGRHP